eukprot:583290-Pyramimonas_sp.AAC.1
MRRRIHRAHSRTPTCQCSLQIFHAALWPRIAAGRHRPDAVTVGAPCLRLYTSRRLGVAVKASASGGEAGKRVAHV